MPPLPEPEASASEVVALARRMHVTIATAESCTGGLVAHLLTEVPGSSQVFLGGWVVYDNRRKTDDLDVEPALITRHGAVSAPVATALAANARRRAAADYALATTGIAGPTGGTPAKPVGTVFIGVATADGAEAFEEHAPGLERSPTKRAFAAAALDRLHQALRARA